MIKKILSFLFTKENLIIFLLFLLFQPLRTQLNNLIYISFDFLFTNGDVSEIYIYNYRGELLGCEEALKMKTNYINYNWFQKNAMYIGLHILSLIAFIHLLKKKYQSKLIFWLLVVISCFSILEAIIQIQVLYVVFIDRPDIIMVRHIISTLLFLYMGFYIFFSIFSVKNRLQIALVAFPSFLLSSVLWFKFIGPVVLPIVN